MAATMRAREKALMPAIEVVWITPDCPLDVKIIREDTYWSAITKLCEFAARPTILPSGILAQVRRDALWKRRLADKLQWTPDSDGGR
jgi:hypothetical protein